MVSFDVESLFTNIPTDETIEILLKLAYPRATLYFQGFTKVELRRLLVVCTKESHFQFNGKFYDQVDGVNMGSPLGPLFANAFMCDFEKKSMTKLKTLGINIWLRYVDDIFACIKNKEQAIEILEFINN